MRATRKNVFYPSKFNVSEIGNTPMRALGRKKPTCFFGNARPKSNARAHLKQRKKHSGLTALDNRITAINRSV